MGREEEMLLQSVTGERFVWQPEGRGIRVGIETDLLDRLLREVLSAFGSTPRRGVEIGGILLGEVEDDGTIAVREYARIECSHKNGPAYWLTDQEQAQFAATVNEWRGRGGASNYPVGFFRSHIREGLGASEDDVRLFDTLFPGDGNLILIVKPYATRASRAGIFFRENGVVHRDSSCEEFDLHRWNQAEAAGTASDSDEVPGKLAALSDTISSAEPWRPFEATPAGHEAASSERISGEAASSEETRGEAAGSEEVSNETTAEVGEADAAAVDEAEGGGAAAAGVNFGEASIGEASIGAAPVMNSEPTTGILGINQPPPSAGGDGNPSPSRRGWVWLPLSFVFLLLGVFLGIQVSVGVGQKLPGVFRAGDPLALNLSAANSGESVHLRWDRGAAVLRSALRARLVISDGGAEKTVVLTPEQLQFGSVIYHRGSANVRFRLEVDVRDRVTLSETLDFRVP